ncbi:hypothetical protein BZG02_10215 [Labilibaculum filiforme]|uniref:T9SS C-terminal target domain-containing protein n=1 Tax=Labilibaculum filiforme TaxID=1940526 RepID=A0A2N3HYL9_9BACT|nr:T9SS C-terminal target domain-containing protein [Labilibaculum filiforme]PKQ63127.1 hypothetical protein BZG02_10215 [Labilibaculum filiforme]
MQDSLSVKVNEQSGLMWYKNLFWVNNDSDCEPILYGYNRSGRIEKEIEITNAKNIDWEDLASDQEYIYIGDFGNNFGSRKDLRVLKLEKKEVGNSNLSKVNVDVIGLEWADQKDFTMRLQKQDFDCEAFLSYGDSLYFFTKNWANYQTRMYSSSKKTEYQILSSKSEFDVDMLVTGAAISSDGKVLALVGYKNYLTYLVLFYDFEGTNFFEGKSLRIDLSPLGAAQTEGIVFAENDSLYISTEESKLPQSIFKIEWEKWIKK